MLCQRLRIARLTEWANCMPCVDYGTSSCMVVILEIKYHLQLEHLHEEDRDAKQPIANNVISLPVPCGETRM